MSMAAVDPALFIRPLTCAQLNQLNTKLDSLIQYPFPSTIPKEKAYAVASFTHAYKVLVNTIQVDRAGCVPADVGMDMNEGMGFNMSMFENGRQDNQKMGNAKRQGDAVTSILCVIVDTILGDNGGEAIPTSSPTPNGGGGAAGARMPLLPITVTVSVSKPPGGAMPMETASGLGRTVKRQNNNGDEGIVEDLVELVGTIIQLLLGCAVGDDSGSGNSNGGA